MPVAGVKGVLAESGQQIRYRRSPRHELVGPVLAIVKFQLRGDPQAVIDGRDNVGRRQRTAAGLAAAAIAGAVYVAALDAAAGQEEAVAKVPVVAAAGAV